MQRSAEKHRPHIWDGWLEIGALLVLTFAPLRWMVRKQKCRELKMVILHGYPGRKEARFHTLPVTHLPIKHAKWLCRCKLCVCVCVWCRGGRYQCSSDEGWIISLGPDMSRCGKHDSWILFPLFVNQRPDLDLAEYQTGLRRPGLSIILPRPPGAASLMLNAAHSRAHSLHYLSSAGLVWTWIFIANGSIKIAGEGIKKQIKARN